MKRQSHILILPVLMVLAMPTSAFAHIGHIGELAGHGHWIGVGALVGAAALAAALARGRKAREEGAEEEAEEPIDAETEPS